MRNLLRRVWADLPRPIRRLLVWIRAPHFVVSVAGAIFNERGEILLCDHVFRKGPPWGMPGGFLDRGEDPAAGLRRELREELGLEIDHLEVAHVRTFPGTRQLEVIYRCTAAMAAPAISSTEVRRFGWFSPEELPELSRDQRELIRRIV